MNIFMEDWIKNIFENFHEIYFLTLRLPSSQIFMNLRRSATEHLRHSIYRDNLDILKPFSPLPAANGLLFYSHSNDNLLNRKLEQQFLLEKFVVKRQLFYMSKINIL